MVDTLHPPVSHAVPVVQDRPEPGFRVWRWRFACLHVLATYFLLISGGLVTSKDAGLAVRTWPLTEGSWIFARMVGNVFYEHGHRLVAQGIGLLTIVYMVWLWRTDLRGWVRRLGVGLLVVVCLQGLLGGLTVWNLLPPQLSVSHGVLAQTFFCLSIATAYFVSREWQEGQQRAATTEALDLQGACKAATAAVFLQLFLGAVLRHNSSQDFVAANLVQDRLFPLHMTHWFGAFLVLVTVTCLYQRVVRQHLDDATIRKPAVLAMAAVAVQIGLGILTIWTEMSPWIATAHVVIGAFILGCLTFLTLRSYREAGA